MRGITPKDCHQPASVIRGMIFVSPIAGVVNQSDYVCLDHLSPALPTCSKCKKYFILVTSLYCIFSQNAARKDSSWRHTASGVETTQVRAQASICSLFYLHADFHRRRVKSQRIDTPRVTNPSLSDSTAHIAVLLQPPKEDVAMVRSSL